jgi:hypothetical protein
VSLKLSPLGDWVRIFQNYNLCDNNYYKRFIEGFSNISHPITSLQKKGLQFEWTPDCVRSFQHFKSLLTSVPILRIDDPNEDYVVCMDA